MRINEASDTLLSDKKRLEYDKLLQSKQIESEIEQ